MPVQKQIKNSKLRMEKADVTATEVDAVVFYARSDLKLGSGFGNAIALRGGPTVRKELENLGPLNVTEAVFTTAGTMKAKHIIHACGPKFQENGTDQKLKATIINTLKVAESIGTESIAFPPMGAGFYGVPIDTSAKITIETITDYLNSGSEIKDVIICANDKREYNALLSQMNVTQKKAV
ncbi:MAG: macro domain-containing protein [Nitrospirae bacterium]|nr:macro domain-containing protein [Nitrospirota bacterium]